MPSAEAVINMDLAFLRGSSPEAIKRCEPIVNECLELEIKSKIYDTVNEAVKETGLPPEQIEINMQVRNTAIKVEERLLTDDNFGVPGNITPALIEMTAESAVKREIRKAVEETGQPPTQVNVEMQSVLSPILEAQPVPPAPQYAQYTWASPTATTTNLSNAALTSITGTATYTGAYLQPYVHVVDNNLTYTIDSHSGGYQYHLTQATDQTYQIYTTTGTVPITFNGAQVGATFTVDSASGSVNWYQGEYKPDPKEIIKQAMRRRLSPEERRRRNYLTALQSPAEQRARDTLRDLLSEADWRRYVTNSFIMVRGPSGKFYQVFNDQRHLQVFEKGKPVAGLCIHSDRECPPTDHVINIKMLIEFDEQAVWQGSNIHWQPGFAPPPPAGNPGGVGGAGGFGYNRQINLNGYLAGAGGAGGMANPYTWGVAGGGGAVVTTNLDLTAEAPGQVVGELDLTNEPQGELAARGPAHDGTNYGLAAQVLDEMLQGVAGNTNVEIPAVAGGYQLAQMEVASYALDGIEAESKDKQSLVDLYRLAKGTKSA